MNTVRTRYVEILETIGARCFTDRLFLFDQSERIAEAIRKQHGDYPEFPWKNIQGMAYSEIMKIKMVRNHYGNPEK